MLVESARAFGAHLRGDAHAELTRAALRRPLFEGANQPERHSGAPKLLLNEQYHIRSNFFIAEEIVGNIAADHAGQPAGGFRNESSVGLRVFYVSKDEPRNFRAIERKKRVCTFFMHARAHRD